MILLRNVKHSMNISRMLVRLAHSNRQIFLTDKYDKFKYGQIFNMSKILSNNILSNLNRRDLNGEKIAVLCSNNYTYLISLLAIWMSNGVPLGLNKQYPTNLIEYFLNDSKCKLVINGVDQNESSNTSVELKNLLDKHKVVNYILDENNFFKQNINNEKINDNDNLDALKNYQNLLNKDKKKEALILYTSGTSGPPKGVVLTCGNIVRTIETLIEAWKINENDKLLHTLPLNHVHGLIYGLLTFMYSGSQIDMMPKFNPEQVWSKLLDFDKYQINCFMAVPTIYVQLVNAYLTNENLRKKYPSEYVRNIFKNNIRLVVSGSAPLNVKTHREWNEITGYNILERYGMTEIGLGLSNPYLEIDNKKRVAGAVGRPYGNTTVRIVDTTEDDFSNVLVQSDPNGDQFFNDSQKKDIFGELQIKGDMVFKEYLNKPVQTKETFSQDGWFKTGDTAEFIKDLKVYKLVGRTSVDVIKSGGYKISALDIEKELLAHPQIDDVAIMGLSDPVWGQKIFALLVLKPTNEKSFDLIQFKDWCKSRLPKYSVPKLVKIIDKMPRNQLGKVNKKELIKFYEKEFK